MNKISVVALSLLVSSVFPFSAQANVQSPSLNVLGYTTEGVRYEVHGTSYVQLTADSIFVTRRVTFDGFILPSDTFFWQEKIDKVTYSGTLQLKSYSYDAKAKKTIATYEGTLTAK